jgi:putative peptidoglycan lipid II flippase
MAAGTLVSRILGFLRASTLVAAIGALGGAANAFDIANRLPDFFYAVLAGGLLNAILVPQIVRAYQGRHGDRFVSRLLTLGISCLAVLTLALTISAGWLVSLYTENWPADQRSLAVVFAFFCIPQLFFFGVYTLLGQLLNARGSFGPFMWAPVVNNVFALLGFGLFILLFGQEDAAGTVHQVGTWTSGQIMLLAGCTTVGVAGQALVLIWPLRRLGFRFKPEWRLRGSGLGSTGRMALWTLGTLALDQIATWVAYRTAGSAPTMGDQMAAGNAVFTNALIVYVLPHSLITVSLTTALFTTMSEAAGRGDIAGVRDSLSYGIRTTSVFTMFATAALIVLAWPLSRLIFFGSSPLSIEAIATALVPLSLGLVPLGVTLLIKRVFFAFEDGRTVFTFQIPMSLLYIVGCIATARYLSFRWWVVGVGLSQTLSYFSGGVLRLNSLRWRIGGVDGRRLVSVHCRLAVAALLSGEIGWLSTHLIDNDGGSRGWAALTLLVAGPVMVGVYLVSLKLLGVRELNDFLAPLGRRISRRWDAGPLGRHRRSS